MFSRQAQNLRDELYQAKLRLEKETSSLKETNKVVCLNLSYSQTFINQSDFPISYSMESITCCFSSGSFGLHCRLPQ